MLSVTAGDPRVHEAARIQATVRAAWHQTRPPGSLKSRRAPRTWRLTTSMAQPLR